jgi:hypothetical protein
MLGLQGFVFTEVGGNSVSALKTSAYTFTLQMRCSTVYNSLECRATLIMSPYGDIRNVPFWRGYDNRNVP